MLPLLVIVLVAQAQQPPRPPQRSRIASTTSQKPAASSTAAPSSEDLPVSLERIQRALAAPAPLKLEEAHPVFRIEVYGKQPTLEDLLGERFWVGPVPYGGMTHQEFMQMSTPKELQPYAGFTGGYLVAESALTLGEQWALKEAIHKFQTAREERQRAAARKEVLDSLAALEKARKDAGLDKTP